MVWTYPDLKLADALLSPALPDPGASAKELNKVTVPGPSVPVPMQAIVSLIMLSSTSDWTRLEALANTARSLVWQTAPTAQDGLINTARMVMAMSASCVTMIDIGTWPTLIVRLTSLSPATISADTLAKITALAIPNATTPKWTPAVTPGDIQTARNQP